MENNKFTQIIAKIVYFGFVRPFRWLYGKVTLWLYEIRFKAARKKAVEITRSTGKACYVVFSDGRFYTYNKGGLLALAKRYKKRTGLSIDWRKLYVFETKQTNEACSLDKEAKR